VSCVAVFQDWKWQYKNAQKMERMTVKKYATSPNR